MYLSVSVLFETVSDLSSRGDYRMIFQYFSSHRFTVCVNRIITYRMYFEELLISRLVSQSQMTVNNTHENK